jgi:hypothetical protein
MGARRRRSFGKLRTAAFGLDERTVALARELGSMASASMSTWC